nr:synaptojanin-1-like [Manis javanica]
MSPFAPLELSAPPPPQRPWARRPHRGGAGGGDPEPPSSWPPAPTPRSPGSVAPKAPGPCRRCRRAEDSADRKEGAKGDAPAGNSSAKPSESARTGRFTGRGTQSCARISFSGNSTPGRRLEVGRSLSLTRLQPEPLPQRRPENGRGISSLGLRRGLWHL